MATQTNYLARGIISPVGEVTFSALSYAWAKKGTDNKKKHMISVFLDTRTAEAKAFIDEIENFGVNASITDVLDEKKKRVPNVKKVTASTYLITENQKEGKPSFLVTNAEGESIAPPHIDTRFDEAKVRLVVSVKESAIEGKQSIRSLQLDGVVVDTILPEKKGKKPQVSTMGIATEALNNFLARNK